ncbi:MAG: topoisomerase [Blastocatellia bacterium]|jgi:DNA topoisomerase-1|nr:topoisomerase [Blastocatellia bacterium]
MTHREKLHTKGILRKGTPKTGFRYVTAEGKKVSAAELQRINDLKIPPAWTEVAINPVASGLVQAVGQDAASRWQYLYHERHVKKQDLKKFARIIKFAEALPQMRRTVTRDLKQPGLGREKVLACILRILATCYMRPGSQVYANENGSYGISTLRARHVSVKGDLIEFDFPGKSGVQQHRELKDRKVARVVRELLKDRRSEVFKYLDAEGKFVDIKRRHINDYIKEVMGTRFSAKDFRTWAGTLAAACALARAGADIEDSPATRKRKIVAAIKEAATVLGNTPAVCRSSYICPAIFENFEKGRVINRYFQTVEQLLQERAHGLHKAEKALLRFLKSNANSNGKTNARSRR